MLPSSQLLDMCIRLKPVAALAELDLAESIVDTCLATTLMAFAAHWPLEFMTLGEGTA